MRIKNYNIVLFFLLISLLNSCGSSKKITKQTTIEVEGNKRFNYDEELTFTKKQKKSYRHYIVYSDREKNKVYNDPYAQERLKDAKFKTAYFVINEKNGFIELVEYLPELVGKPEGVLSLLRNGKRHFIDSKEVKYVGWISKNNLLHFDHSFLNPINYQPTRYILGINTKNILVDPKKYIDEENAILYQEPTLTNKAEEKLALSDIVYVYKYNTERTSALVSNKNSLGDGTEEEKTGVLGWVSVDMLSRVGQKQVFLWNEESLLKFKYSKTDSLYHLGKHSIGSSILFNTEDHKKFAFMLENDTVKVNMATPVWDHSENSLISLNGNKITNDLRVIIDRENKVFNLNFIFDCSSYLGENEAQLIGSLQKLKVLIAEKKIKNYKINYAVSSFGCNRDFELKRTQSFTKWIGYIQDIFSGKEKGKPSKDNSIDHSFYSVLNGDNQSFENNLMIVVGSKKFKEKVNFKKLIKKLTTTSSKLLFFQLESGIEEDYQNFILQSKILLASVADNYTEYMKGFNVDYNLVKPENTFVPLESNVNVFMFDSPKNSSYQGGIVFPSIEGVSTPQDFEMITDSLITKTIEFNKLCKDSREHFAKEFSFMRSKPNGFLKTLIQFNDSIQPFKSNPDELFYTDVNLVLSKPDSLNSNNISTGYLVNKEELEIMIDKYRSLVPLYQKEITKKERRYLSRLYCENRFFYNEYILSKKIAKNGSLADLLYAKTGIPIYDSALDQIKFKDIKKKKALSNELLSKSLTTLREKIDKLENLLNNLDTPYHYGKTSGEDYYFIPTNLTL